jgi:hypothetical protein
VNKEDILEFTVFFFEFLSKNKNSDFAPFSDEHILSKCLDLLLGVQDTVFQIITNHKNDVESLTNMIMEILSYHHRHK